VEWRYHCCSPRITPLDDWCRSSVLYNVHLSLVSAPSLLKVHSSCMVLESLHNQSSVPLVILPDLGNCISWSQIIHPLWSKDSANFSSKAVLFMWLLLWGDCITISFSMWTMTTHTHTVAHIHDPKALLQNCEDSEGGTAWNKGVFSTGLMTHTWKHSSEEDIGLQIYNLNGQ
jgi:hypothetical protein